VELKLTEKQVEIELDWQWGQSAKCPECGRAGSSFFSRPIEIAVSALHQPGNRAFAVECGATRICDRAESVKGRQRAVRADFEDGASAVHAAKEGRAIELAVVAQR